MNCCTECFIDKYLIEIIREYGEEGICNYCNSEDVYIISVKELSSYFNVVNKLYRMCEPGENMFPDDKAFEVGELLFDLFNAEWEVFSPWDGAERLFIDLMDHTDSDIDYLSFYRSSKDSFYERRLDDLWETLSSLLKTQNRFFPGHAGGYSQHDIEEVIDMIPRIFSENAKEIKAGFKLIRARIGTFTEKKDLTAPPSNYILNGGRANPAGIRMLYCVCAEEIDRETAVKAATAEIRPSMGAKITIADVATKETLTLVDLSSDIGVKSIFELSSSEYPADVLDAISLMKAFVINLSKPVLADTAQIDYVPTQYLASLAEHHEFDGIIFKSSVGEGINYVIFRPESCEIKGLSHYEIKSVEYEIMRDNIRKC